MGRCDTGLMGLMLLCCLSSYMTQKDRRSPLDAMDDQSQACMPPGSPVQPVFNGDYSINTGRPKTFTVADYIIFAAILVISIAIGFYHAWSSKLHMSLEDYLAAGRSMKAFPVSLSLLATFTSAVSLLGHPTEMYEHSTMWMWCLFGYFFSIAAAAHIYVPVFYQLQVTTVHQYLEMRFDRSVRLIASSIFLITMITYTGMIMYVPSLAIHTVTGMSLSGSLIAIGVTCILYTALGGMKAVIYTDTFHIAVMFIGYLALLIQANKQVGASLMWESAKRTNRLVLFDFTLDPTVRYTVWSVSAGSFINLLQVYGVNQVQIQRCLTCRSLKDTKIAVWMNYPARCTFFMIGCFIGLYMSAFYENCDPDRAKLVESSTKAIVPLFMMDILSDVVGLPGLGLIAIFSATLSTISACLHSMSAVVMADFVKLYVTTHLSEERERLAMQIAIVVFGVVCLELATAFSRMEAIFSALVALGAVLSAPILGLFSLGLFFPWANKWGGVIGIFGSMGSMVLMILQALSHYKPEVVERCVSNCNISTLSPEVIKSLRTPVTTAAPWTDADEYPHLLSFMWYPVIGFLLTLILGMIASFVTGLQDPKNSDPRLIVPLCDHVFPFYYLPEATRKRYRFGINHEGKFDPRPKESTIAPIITPIRNTEDLQGMREVSQDISIISHSEKSKSEVIKLSMIPSSSVWSSGESSVS